MWTWLHHLLEPHCEACALERQDKRICQSCETLKSQLATANHEKQQLLNRILELTAPAQKESPRTEELPEQLKPRTIPWQVRKQMLEEEDRQKAVILRQQQEAAKKAIFNNPVPSGNAALRTESIKDLEKELGVEEGAS